MRARGWILIGAAVTAAALAAWQLSDDDTSRAVSGHSPSASVTDVSDMRRPRQRVEQPTAETERAAPDAGVAEREHVELLADLHARGEPVTVAEADPPLPPDGENGAHDLDLARAWWETHEPAEGWDERTAGPWNPTLVDWQDDASPDQMQVLTEFLTLLEPLFAHVDRATNRSEIAWPYTARSSAAEWFDSPVPAAIPWLQELAHFLSARTVAGGTPEERCAGIRGRLAIGARYRARFTIDHLVASVIFHYATLALRHALEEQTIDPIRARAELDALLTEQFLPRLPTWVRYERAHQLEMIPFWLDGFIEAELAQRRADEGETAARDEAGAATRLRWLRELDRYADAGHAADERRGNLPSYAHPGNVVMSLIDKVRQQQVDTDCAARLGRVALAAYAYRKRHGAWPQNAVDLAPLFPDGVPLDPFTGEAFLVGQDGEHLTLRAQRWERLPSRGGWDGDPRRAGDDWRLPPR